VHAAWYATTLLASLLFLLMLPPLQSNDETGHWGRVWSVAFGGGLVCRTVPAVGAQLPDAVDYNRIRNGTNPYHFASLDAARAIKGSTDRRRAWGACFYSPVAYVLPALAMRLVSTPTDPSQRAGLVSAFYAARVVNWTLMGAAVLAFLLLAPELRNLTLVLYSLPMVTQQTISINQDSTIFLFMFALLAVALRPPGVAQLVALAAAVAGLTLLKVVYFPLVLVLVGAWLRLRREGRPLPRAAWWALGALALAPLIAEAAWARWNAGRQTALPPGIDPRAQLAYVRSHPFAFLGTLAHQVGDFFGDGHMNGGWPGIFGVLGWASWEIGGRAFRALGGAVVVALVADAVQPPREGTRLRLWGDAILPLVGAVGVVVATATAMYFVFSGPGAPFIAGVQGRYLHVPLFVMLAVAVRWAQAWGARHRTVELVRRGAPLMSWLAFGLCAIGIVDGFATLARVYYF